MKIQGNNANGSIGGLPLDRKAQAGQTKATEARDSQPSAKVEISRAASLLADAADDPTFDAARVERMADAIRSGDFKVNAEKIADRLLASTGELLTAAGKR